MISSVPDCVCLRKPWYNQNYVFEEVWDWMMWSKLTNGWTIKWKEVRGHVRISYLGGMVGALWQIIYCTKVVIHYITIKLHLYGIITLSAISSSSILWLYIFYDYQCWVFLFFKWAFNWLYDFVVETFVEIGFHKC